MPTGGTEGESVASPSSVGTRTKMDDPPSNQERKEITMSDEQIEVMAATMSNVSLALGRVRRDVAHRIRNQQKLVADRRRDAQVNQDLLKLRLR